jgi:hypothetical protein
MTNMANSRDVYGRAGNWLIGTAKRHPEALLVLAAGCALLVRNGGGSSQGASTQMSNEKRQSKASDCENGGLKQDKKVTTPSSPASIIHALAWTPSLIFPVNSACARRISF